MRIIIVSGSLFPEVSPRSFRATELACGLAKLGHDVTIYAILGKYDYAEFEREHNIKIRDMGPSKWGNRDCDMRPRQKVKKTPKVIWRYGWHKILGPLIDYPQCEYFFLSRRVLEREEYADMVISIAKPYGNHWGCAYFRKKYGNRKFKTWVADCGDPMMGNPHNNYRKVFLTPIEKFWCKHVDRIVVPVENARLGYFIEYRNKISVIPQGIDFSSVKTAQYVKNLVPTFLYCGAVYENMRDPTELLEYLCSFGDKPFKFIVYSRSKLFDSYQERLGNKMEIRTQIPRKDLMFVQSQMDFLININNVSGVQTPSKLIDYSLSQRPILNVSSHMTEDEKSNLRAFFDADYSQQYIVPNIEQYDSVNVAQRFVDLCPKQ